MGNRASGSSDNSKLVQVTDFSLGLNSMYGGFYIGSNEALADRTQNVIGFPGRCLYVGGFNASSALASNAVDGAWQFYDYSGAKHQIVWANGNIYDCVTGVPVTIATGVYTAGQNIARVDQSGVLLYCTPKDAMRIYNGLTESALPGGPKGSYLTAFAGSVLVANPTPADPANPGKFLNYQPGAFLPSAVNDFTTWLLADMQQVGTDYGGIISFILPMGVTAAGVSPTKSMLVGKTVGTMYMYSGAIGQQNEAVINCPVGCLDANSAVYIPSSTLYGEVIFLGTDSQLWVTNGITADQLTEKNLSLVYSLVNTSRTNNPSQRFFGTYNERYSYYLMDLGNNQQFIYRWKTKSLFFVNGWPSGAYFQGTSANGFPTNYVAANNAYTAGLYQVGQDNIAFNGVNPNITYQTPYMHGGNAEITKDWNWVALMTRNIGSSYIVQGTSMPSANGAVLLSQPLTFTDPLIGTGNTSSLWDIGSWDLPLWSLDSGAAGVPPAIGHGMLDVSVPASTWVPVGTTQPLRSGAVSFIISWNSAQQPPQFDVIGLQARYNPRSMKTSGGKQYTAQKGINLTGADFFMGNQYT